MQQMPKDMQHLDEKIQKMKQKGFGKSEKKHAKFYQASIAVQVVIELLSGVVVGVSIGYMLNEIFDFGSIFLISLIILGGIAGCLNVARYLKQEQQMDSENEDMKNG